MCLCLQGYVHGDLVTCHHPVFILSLVLRRVPLSPRAHSRAQCLSPRFHLVLLQYHLHGPEAIGPVLPRTVFHVCAVSTPLLPCSRHLSLAPLFSPSAQASPVPGSQEVSQSVLNRARTQKQVCKSETQHEKSLQDFKVIPYDTVKDTEAVMALATKAQKQQAEPNAPVSLGP